MASLLNTKISNTYVGLIKTLDNAVISSSLKELSDGSGNATGIHINNAGDLKVTNILEFGSLKDTGENITISKFVDAADGIGSNNNDTTIPTSAAVATYVAAQITLEDLDFSGDSGTGSVDLDSQVFAVVGTANEIETSAGSQQLQIGLPNNVTISGNLQVNGLLKGNNNIVIKDTSDRTMAAFYGGDKVELYFNDSKKFETTSGGVTVTGGITATGGSVFTGATFSSDVDFADNAKARFGAGNDLQIFHDGSNSRINETGTGNLIIQSTNFQLLKGDGGEFIMQGISDAEVSLYYDGSKKFETTSTGVTVTGNVAVGDGSESSPSITFSGDTDTGIYRTASNAINFGTNGAERMRLTNTGLGIGTQSPAYKIDISGTLRATGESTFTSNLLFPDSSRIKLGTGEDLQIFHNGTNNYIEINNGHFYITNFSDDKDIAFFTDNGAGGTTEFLRFDGGDVRTVASREIRTIDGVAFKAGASGDLGIFHDGTNSNIQNQTGDFNIFTDSGNMFIYNNATDGNVSFQTDDGAGGTTEYFKLSGSLVLNEFSQHTRAIDGKFLGVGNSTDLYMLHDGTNSHIKNGTGNLTIEQQVDDGDIILRSDDGSGGTTEYFKISGSTESIITSKSNFFGDNVKAIFGAGSDLQIFHNGSHSFIQDIGTGDLRILSSKVEIFNASASETMAKFTEDSAVELYHNGSKRFETTAGGVVVTGTLDTSNTIVATGGNIRVGSDTGKFMAGASNDLQIYHDGTKSVIEDTGTGDLHIIGDNDIVFKDGSGNILANMNAINSVELNFAGSNKFATTSSGVSVTGNIVLTGDTITNNNSYYESKTTGGGSIRLIGIDNNDAIYIGSIDSGADNVYIRSAGTNAISIDSSQDVSLAGSLTIAQDLTVNGTTTTVNTSTLAVEDPLISMAKDNSANSVDIGFYGRYNDGTDRYTGLFMDASSGTEVYRLFKGLTTEPTTTVNLSGTGYTAASLIIDGLTAGNITASGDISIASAQKLYFGGGSHTYISEDIDDRLRFFVGGAEFMRFTEDGSDTINLYKDATFAGDVTATSKKFISTSSSSGDYVRLYAGSGTAQWDIYGSGENLRLSENSSGGGIFQVDSGATFGGSIASKEISIKQSDDSGFDAGLIIERSANTQKLVIGMDGGAVNFNSPDGLTYKFRNNGTEKASIDGSGNATFAGSIIGTSAQFIDTSNPDGGSGTGEGGSVIIEGRRDGTANLLSLRSRDASAPTVALPNGQGGLIRFQGFDGTDFAQMGAIAVVADGQAVANNDAPSKMIFYTVADGGEALTTALTLDKSQNATFAGDVTLSGFIDQNGSSPNLFTGNINIDNAAPIIQANSSNAGSGLRMNITGLDADGDTLFRVQDTNTTRFTINKNGNATFTGDVTSTGGTIKIDASGSGEFIVDRGNDTSGAVLEYHTAGTIKWFHGLRGNSTDDFFLFNYGTGATALQIESSNSNATFAGTISSTDLTTVNKSNSGAQGGSLLLRNAAGGAGAHNRIYFAPTASSYTTRSCIIEGQNADGNNNMALIFKTSNGADPTEKYRIDSSGHTFKSLTGSGQACDLRLHSTNTSGFGSTYAIKSTIRSVVDDSSNAHNSKLQFFVNNTSGNLTNAFTIQESSATFGGQISASAGGFSTTSNVNSTGDAGVNIANGARLGFDQSGTRSWTINAASGNLNINSGDGNGSLSTGTKGIIAGSGTFSGSSTFANTAPLTPIIKAKSNQLNGYTILGDNYASDESQVTIGIQYSSAGLVLGQGVKPSNDTNNKYLSSQDTYANKSSALVMAGGDFKFKNTSTSATTTTNTEVSLSERMRISNDGRLFLGTALGNIGAAQLSLQTNGGRGYGFNDTSGNSGTKASIFHSQATEVGSISINSSSTAYNTSSDYRLKEDLKDFAGLDMVSKIPVYDFKWKVDDNRGYGVMAHELEEVLPQAVTGEKDAEDMQGVDYSKIVPLLVKSIQELKKEVDTLKKECKCN